MSAREELAAAIEAVHYRPYPVTEQGGTIYQLAADVLIRDGWHKLRQITTDVELEALPVGSVILDPVGISLHKNGFTGWRASNGAKNIDAEMLAREGLPAIVLWEPEATR